MDGMAPRDDKKKERTGLRGLPGSSSSSSGCCSRLVVVGVCRGRQGGGHRVKMRGDPPSGARTLIDFLTSPTFASPLSPFAFSPRKYTRPYSFLGCLSRPRGNSSLSRSSRDLISDDFLRCSYECLRNFAAHCFLQNKENF